MIIFLYILYVSCLASIFALNFNYLPQYIFVYSVIPSAVLIFLIGNKHTLLDRKSYRIKDIFNIIVTAIMRSKILLCAIGYIFFICMSTYIASNFSYGWLITLLYFSFPIIFYLLVTIYLLDNIDQFVFKLFLVLCGIVSANAIINLFFYVNTIGGIHNFIHYRFAPPWGNAPDHFSTTASLTYSIFFLPAFFYSIEKSSFFIKLYFIFCSLTLVIAIILSQCRGSLLSLILIILLYALLSSQKLRKILLALIFTITIIYISIPEVGLYAFSRGGNYRLEIWREFIYLALNHPLFGYGETRLFEINVNNSIIGHAHNIFLSAQIRGGIAALLCLILLVIFSVSNCWKYYYTTKNFIPLSLILLITGAGIFDYEILVFMIDWQWPTFWLPIGLACAVEVRLRRADITYCNCPVANVLS